MENRIVKRVTAIIFLVFIFGMSGMYLRKFPSLWRNIIESRSFNIICIFLIHHNRAITVIFSMVWSSVYNLTQYSNQ